MRKGSILTARVSMLSNHPAMAAGWVQTQLLTHQVPEPGRVQVGAATNHTIPGKATQLPRHIGQDINYICSKFCIEVKLYNTAKLKKITGIG